MQAHIVLFLLCARACELCIVPWKGGRGGRDCCRPASNAAAPAGSCWGNSKPTSFLQLPCNCWGNTAPLQALLLLLLLLEQSWRMAPPLTTQTSSSSLLLEFAFCCCWPRGERELIYLLLHLFVTILSLQELFWISLSLSPRTVLEMAVSVSVFPVPNMLLLLLSSLNEKQKHADDDGGAPQGITMVWLFAWQTWSSIVPLNGNNSIMSPWNHILY